ncbi:uncharacterized protein LOC143917465 [Arctopsyche grandis]|uniref:uncharacterized protein LOC143917465 n=1 Tax=Arctopsyche grandis TaxID=121162 RepID=UPI00406D6D34
MHRGFVTTLDFVYKKLMSNVIEATIVTGCAKGEDVFIPRIPLIPTDMPFQFKRILFPALLAFAKSINKAQSQSLKVAGIDLSDDCFAQGQLYVAYSKVGTGKNLYILAEDEKTRNIITHIEVVSFTAIHSHSSATFEISCECMRIAEYVLGYTYSSQACRELKSVIPKGL